MNIANLTHTSVSCSGVRVMSSWSILAPRLEIGHKVIPGYQPDFNSRNDNDLDGAGVALLPLLRGYVPSLTFAASPSEPQ
jgi:hypothetical protein